MTARRHLSRQQPPVATTLTDDAAERVRRNHDERIRELQSAPLIHGRLFRGIELPNAQRVDVPHGLGRPAVALVSWPYQTFGTSGRISMSHAENPDPRLYVSISAVGWSATITVDVVVF